MTRTATAQKDSVRFVALARALLEDGRAVRFRAHGWSMHPAIDDGEAITVEPVRLAHVKVGDVLLCRRGHGVTAHRVIGIDTSAEPRRLVLRGDAAAGPDKPIGDDDVLGRVVSVERDGRTVRVSRSWRAARAFATAQSTVRGIVRRIPR